MIYNIHCPVCDFSFEAEEEERLTEHTHIMKEGGNCPNCNAHYDFDYDCEYEGAIVIADFDFNYMKPYQKHIEKIRAIDYISSH